MSIKSNLRKVIKITDDVNDLLFEIQSEQEGKPVGKEERKMMRAIEVQIEEINRNFEILSQMTTEE